tara:strand:- start:25531 stop:25965 length:435 start_codon:yes stop_codon:yes gene_type:complete
MTEEAKHAGGRPTAYLPEYCDLIIDAAKAGLSLTAFAGQIGVCRDTLYEWRDQHSEFSDAIKKHRAARVLYLETSMLGAEAGHSVTSRIFALKNACPEEWRDKQEHEHTGKDGGPIKTEDVTPLDTARAIAFLLSKGAAEKETN